MKKHGFGTVENLKLGGSGYLGYVDNNQGEKKPISVGNKMYPNPRVISIYITNQLHPVS